MTFEPVIPQVIAGFCGAVLIYAGAAKVRSIEPLAASLSWFIRTSGAARTVGVIVTGLELLFGIALFVDLLRPVAALGAMALMTAFTITLGVARVSGVSASCVCFGGDAEPITWSLVLRDLGLTVLLVIASLGGDSAPFATAWIGAAIFLLLVVTRALRLGLSWIWSWRLT